MGKVIVAGVGPTPMRNAEKLYAPGLRLWIFAETLASAGHEVLIAEAGFEEGVKGVGEDLREESYGAGIRAIRVGREGVKLVEQMRRILEEERPGCVVSTTDVMNNAVARAGVSVPQWFDFNGHPMAERQMQAAVYGSDAGIMEQWQMIVPALLSGDHFSTCSEAQKYALIGELGVCGRLNRETVGVELVDVLPPGSMYKEDFKRSGRAFRGDNVGEGDFVVLWNGGYNTWVDVKTLFEGLEYAMEREARVQYVSTGGAITGHDERTFDEFKALVKGSRNRGRYHFHGWVKTEELANYYLEADCAINIDKECYETLLGCRNRIFAWINAGLPVMTTALSEITILLEGRGLVKVFAAGDGKELGELILEGARDRGGWKEMGERAKRFVREEYGNEKLLRPLLSWVKEPRRASDVREGEGLRRPENLLSKLQGELANLGNVVKEREEEMRGVKAELERIRKNPLYRIYKKLGM